MTKNKCYTSFGSFTLYHLMCALHTYMHMTYTNNEWTHSNTSHYNLSKSNKISLTLKKTLAQPENKHRKLAVPKTHKKQMSLNVRTIWFDSEGGRRLYLPLPDRVQTSVPPPTVLFIVYGSFGSRDLYHQSVQQTIGTALQLLEKIWNWKKKKHGLRTGLSLVNKSETDEHDFNIKYSYINSRLKTFTVLHDRQYQTKQKGTNI